MLSKRLYSLGFMFSPNGQYVVLIRKTKPEWQKGHLNGVGGKVENGELFSDAMVREFEEETGVVTSISDWHQFATMTGEEWVVACFVAFDLKFDHVSTKTEEVIFVCDVNRVLAGHEGSIIPNLQWLIPMALSEEGVTAEIHHPSQP